jgi:hypothetical protein
MALPNIYLHICGHLLGFDAGGIIKKINFQKKILLKMKLGQVKCFYFIFKLFL